MKTTEQIKKELTLILMYLNQRCEYERMIKKNITYSFKGYDFDDINALSEEEYIIDDGYKSKRISFTDKGIEKAKKLLKEWNIEE